MKTFKRAFLAILLIAAVSLAGCEQNKNVKSFTIGVLADKTGVMSGHGSSIEKGAKVAEQVLNANGGVLGMHVKLIILDAQSDPTTTADRTKELVEKDSVNVIIGTGTSASTLAAIGPATKAGVPFIYSLDGECKTCAMGKPTQASGVIWGSGFTERMIVKPYLSYLASKFKKPNSPFKIYLIGGDYVYPRTTNAYAGQVAQQMGFEIVGEEYSDMATKDYTQVIRRIIRANPDLLIVTNPGAAGVNFMRQAIPLGLNKLVTIGGFATFDQEAVEAMGKASEGVFVINRYSKFLDNAENKIFLAAYRKLYPYDHLLPGPTSAAGAYGSILVAAKAFNSAGNLSKAGFTAAMKKLEINLPQGPIRVNPTNNIFDQHIYIMQIKDQQYQVVEDIGMQTQPGFEGCSVK